MPQSPGKKQDDDIGFSRTSDRDIFGQLSRKAWSCLFLDVGEKLSKLAGKKGVELYYRITQQAEAHISGFGGEKEREIEKVTQDAYVKQSQAVGEYISPRLSIMQTGAWKGTANLLPSTKFPTQRMLLDSLKRRTDLFFRLLQDWLVNANLIRDSATKDMLREFMNIYSAAGREFTSEVWIIIREIANLPYSKFDGGSWELIKDISFLKDITYKMRDMYGVR